jgi:glucose-6-phosphate 1-epimerase
MNIEQLNAKFGIAKQIEIIEGNGGLPFISITNSSAKALISIYAGQVLSFQPAGESDDLMFLSDKAYYQEGKAIKGGVPICWPWFGPDPDGSGRPAHGFVRNRLWNLLTTEITQTGETKVVLGLVDTEETSAIWPYSFELAIAISVGKTLTLELITRNTDVKAFSITQAFHTYFSVGDIDQVKVLGLEGKNYIDKVEKGVQKQQEGAIKIASEVDRIYTNTSGKLVIDDDKLKRRIIITSQGSNTAVVWNPWAEICSQMADLDNEAYKKLICVETTNAADDIVIIEPGQSFKLVAIYDIQYK